MADECLAPTELAPAVLQCAQFVAVCMLLQLSVHNVHTATIKYAFCFSVHAATMQRSLLQYVQYALQYMHSACSVHCIT